MKATLQRPRSRTLGLPRAPLVGLFYLGAGFAMPQWLDIDLGLVSSRLLVALVLATFGWKSAVGTTVFRGYLPWAGVLAVAAVLSSLSLWALDALYWSATFTVWLVFIVPGLAGLLRAPSARRAFIAGLAVGVAVYGGVAVWRIASGAPLLEGNVFLGLNRNDANLRVLFGVSLLALHGLGLSRWIRRALIVSGGIWLLASGGRSALVGLAAVVVAYVLLQPGLGRRLRLGVGVAAAGLILFASLAHFGGPFSASMDRLLTTFQSSEEDAADERRELALRRSWMLGWQNPIFGVGYDRVQGVDHEVLEGASNRRVHQGTLSGGTHNAFIELFAFIGVGALLGFLGLLVFFLKAGFRSRLDPDIVATSAALVGVWATLFFLASGGDVLFASMAISLGAAFGFRSSTGRPDLSATSMRARDVRGP